MPRPMEHGVWRPYGVAGVLATGVFFLLPSGGLAQALLFTAVQGAAVIAIAYRIERYRPHDRVAWLILLAGSGVYTACLLWWFVYPAVTGVALSFPSGGDALALLSYGIWAVFVGRLIWRQRQGDTAASLDAIVVALALSVLTWEAVVEPAVETTSVSEAGRAVAIGYPVMLLVLATVAVRLAMVARVRTGAHALLGIWLGLELVTDTWYCVSFLNGSFEYGSPWFAGWMLSYTALGMLALHPEAAELTRPARARPGGGAPRLVALALSVASALLVIGAQADLAENAGEMRVLLGVVGLMVALVVVRLAFDLSERHRAEAEANRRAATVEAILSASPDPIVVADADGVVTTMSAAADRLIGPPDGGWVGRRIVDFVHPDDRGRWRDALVPVQRGDAEAVAVRHRLDGPAPGTVVDSHITQLREGAGRGLVVVVRDVTDQVASERDLRVAKDEAESANTAKTEFLSRMSHELRTPLNAVLGFAQLMEREELGDDQRESVVQILRAGRHLLDLINDVLDISRVESGQLSISAEPVCVADVVTRAVEMTRGMAAERSIRVATSGDADTFVQADDQRLVQVLINLVANGIKYNREGGSVTVRWSHPDDASVRIDVEDTGNGIPQALLPRLFTPFDRLGAESTGVEGTGVGLALSKRLVEAMGGSLRVATGPRQGSTFSVVLNAAVNPTEVLDVAVGKRRPSPSAGGAHAVVLYVEDNIANLRLIERVLRERPHVELLAAMQGSFAIELARSKRPRLVLLDQHLPDMTGEEVLAALRSDPRTADIPVIAVSADARPGAIRRLRDAGAKAYLTKPLDIDDFLAVLDAELAQPTRR